MSNQNKKQRPRILQKLLVVVLVLTFLMCLPIAKPARQSISIFLNHQTWSLLQHPRVVEAVVVEDWRYPAWYSHWLNFHKSNLASLGETAEILIEVSKEEYEQINNSNHIVWLPDGIYSIGLKGNETDGCFFSALINRDYLDHWNEFAELVKQGKKSLVVEN